MRTDVAIIGAGPAGLLLAHLLAQDGIESIVVEARTQEYVAARIRAGILESSSVDLLRSVGLGAGIEAHGDEHRGIYLQWPSERHHLDFVDLVGRSVWVYGQTQLQADLVAASEAAGPDGLLRHVRRRAARPGVRPPVTDVHRCGRQRAADRRAGGGGVRRVVRAEPGGDAGGPA